MFNTVNMTYNEKTTLYTFTGNFGHRLPRTILKGYLSKKKIKYLFNSLSKDKVEVYGFFILELHAILKDIIETGPILALNRFLIINFVKILETQTWMVNIDKDFPDTIDYKNIDNKFNFKILEHQKTAFSDYVNIKTRLGYNGFMLDAAAGSGKTFLSLALLVGLNKSKVIIFTPLNALEEVWINTLTNDTFKENQTFYTSLDFDKKKYDNEKYIIVHYESIKKLDKILGDIDTTDTGIIIDESHNFAEFKANRTKDLLEICQKINSTDIILMSGTPVKAKVHELITMLTLLDPKLTPTAKKRFLKLYHSPNGFFANLLPDRYKKMKTTIEKNSIGLPKLRKEDLIVKLKNGKDFTLKSISNDIEVYVKKRTVELEDNYSTYSNRFYTLINKSRVGALSTGVTEESFKRYRQDLQTVIEHYDKNQLGLVANEMKMLNLFEKNVICPNLDSSDTKEFNDIKSIVKYMSLKIQGEVLGRIVLKARIDCHKAIAETINYKNIINSTDKKTLVFSNYVDICKTVDSKTRKLGYSPINVYGDNTKNIPETISKFTNNKSINPLIATYKSLSTAVPVIAANVMLIIDLPFREYILNQAISRIWRLGQDRPVKVFIARLDTGDEVNINDRNVSIIEWYKKEVERITGTTSGLDLDFDVRSIVSLEGFNRTDAESILDRVPVNYTINLRDEFAQTYLLEDW